MSITHISGFPRIGAKRELKFTIEKYWRNEISEDEVFKIAKEIRTKNYLIQQQSGIDLIPINDFSYYDHILDAQILVGAIPKRFGFDVKNLSLKEYFQLARGNKNQTALEMTKWFDTNYHYLVPEWNKNTKFSPVTNELIKQIKEAENYNIKPTIIGPLTLLWLGKTEDENFNKLDLLPNLIETYKEIIKQLVENNVAWVQIDEPILTIDLPKEWINGYNYIYEKITSNNIKIIIGTYFESIDEHIELLKNLPINGIHIDCVKNPKQLNLFAKSWTENKVLSVGIIDGRNVWKNDITKSIEILKPIHNKFADNLWISTSCSLLHTPQDLDIENKIPKEIKKWLSFSTQKLKELSLIKKGLNLGSDSIIEELKISDQIVLSRKNSTLINKSIIKQKIKKLENIKIKRNSEFLTRKQLQQEKFKLPILPTTTIGSFPQTQKIRKCRAQLKKGEISYNDYIQTMKKEISFNVKMQEELDIDVLVHGEPERNDMVEYFAEQLEGYIFSEFGWVQSYGTRCVKPPIIYGDIQREKPISILWSSYAQSLTKKPMKGMLTGPVTMLQWSFIRNDIPKFEVCKQIAIALNEEVLDLEKAGIKIIQIDEPAYREGLPIKKKDWDFYLDWASKCFQITCLNIKDETQIHTHMCYSEFNDILPAIASMDADVITIETSRSKMELLDAFTKFKYPNDIGPGVYDIHSPRIPDEQEIETLIKKALEVIDKQRLWINPDCGLKTRSWEEVRYSLQNMVKVTKKIRLKLN